MKGDTSKRFIKVFCLLLAFISWCEASISQEKLKQQSNEFLSLLQQKEYVFRAEYVLPLAGPSRYSNADYYLIVSKDTLNSYLPYIGRAYSAPLDPKDIGLDFVSTHFEHKIKPAKKGSWNIIITLHDAKDVREITLNVFNNGRASLHVICNNRQAIMYSGYITKKNGK